MVTSSFFPFQFHFQSLQLKMQNALSQKPLLPHAVGPGTDLLHTNSYAYTNLPHCICYFPSFDSKICNLV